MSRQNQGSKISLEEQRLEIKIVYKYNSYVDVPDPSDALEFGTQGISFRARKPK